MSRVLQLPVPVSTVVDQRFLRGDFEVGDLANDDGVVAVPEHPCGDAVEEGACGVEPWHCASPVPGQAGELVLLPAGECLGQGRLIAAEQVYGELCGSDEGWV